MSVANLLVRHRQYFDNYCDMERRRLRLAILDLYNGQPNQGMRCIKEIVNRHEDTLDWKVFDVRSKAEVPNTDFDIYISSGGPGSPHDGNGVWDMKYYEWLDSVWKWNQHAKIGPKKYVFFICHSFQMACKFFKIGQVIKRQSMSFGTFPIHKTDAGIGESLFEGLDNPFYAADFRHWQVVQPDLEQIESLNAQILALEKIRPHIPLERAIMAVRFSHEFFGTQFHPEADPEGMVKHFIQEKWREQIIEKHGKEKYISLIEHLNDPDKIRVTHELVLPVFIQNSIRELEKSMIAVPGVAAR